MPSKCESHTERTGCLYVVATPIGNLEDITYRAVRILSEVDFVAAEDTRRTRKLLTHYGIHNKVVAYHSHSGDRIRSWIVDRLCGGASVALVSDGGTPLLSDPGIRLVADAWRSRVPVVPVPGPAAPLAALCVAGFRGVPFLFAGFLPRRKGVRRKRLEELARSPFTVVLFESPRRIAGLLEDLEPLLGERKVLLAREMTKLHETFLRGTLATVRQRLTPESMRGEFTLVIEGADGGAEPETSVLEELESQVGRTDLSRMEIVKQIARRRGIAKSEVYKESLRLNWNTGEEPDPEDE